MKDFLVIKGARENNLKNINLTIPRDKLVVFTGLSGSGKSTLAFETIYAEGQRRYVESLSSYARMFLGQMEKPDVDLIEGLSPAISIDQKTTSHNPRSTVGAVTEIYDYFRLLFARVGVPHCPNCGREIAKQTVDQIADKIMALGEGKKIYVNAPVIRGKKGEYSKLFEGYKKSGFARVEVDGVVYDLGEDIILDKNKKHSISVVVDRLVVKDGMQKRLTDSLESAIKLADGLVEIQEVDGEETLYSLDFFERSQYADKLHLHIGSALETMQSLNQAYDLVFIDGDKREYTAYYNMLFDKGLVRSGSWIMADNILWYGKVVEPVAKGDKQTQGIIDFNAAVTADSRVENVILPIRDGINLIRVK